MLGDDSSDNVFTVGNATVYNGTQRHFASVCAFSCLCERRDTSRKTRFLRSMGTGSGMGLQDGPNIECFGELTQPLNSQPITDVRLGLICEKHNSANTACIRKLNFRHFHTGPRRCEGATLPPFPGPTRAVLTSCYSPFQQPKSPNQLQSALHRRVRDLLVPGEAWETRFRFPSVTSTGSKLQFIRLWTDVTYRKLQVKWSTSVKV